jgi:Domain of unknown function (DUF4386)
MHRIMEPPVQHDASDVPTRGHLVRDGGWSIRSASLTAGVAILLLSVLAGFGSFVAVQSLVTEGDAAQTAKDITGSDGLFRFGVVSLFLVVALDVVVAWALYRVFSPVSRSLSMLATCLRLVYAGVFLVAVSQLLGVLRLLGNDAYLLVFIADQLHAQALSGIGTFNDVWAAGLVLFGLHLLVIGYLGYRSGYVPRFLAVLLAIAGLGYVVDSFGAELSRGPWTDASFTFIGEFLLALWLLIWGRRLTSTETGLHQDPIAAAQ